MFFFLRKFWAILFFVFIETLLAEEINSYEELMQLYCLEKQQNYQAVLNPALRNIRKTEKAKEALIITLKTTCRENLPEWRIKILFLLSHFALENGVDSVAAEKTLSLYLHDSIGKEEYLRLARLWEKLQKTGLREEEIQGFFIKTKKEKLRSIQLEGLALYYVQLRSEGLSQENAYEEILPLYPQIKKIHHHQSVYKWVKGLILQRIPLLNLGDNIEESLWDYYYQKVRS